MKKIENFEIRACIRFRKLIRIQSQDIFNELKSCRADIVQFKATIDKWVDCFKKGGESLEDQRRSGRQKPALNNANIKEQKSKLIITYKEI